MTLGQSLTKKIRGLKSLQRSLPVLVGETAKNFFQDSFRNQGFTDSGLKKWKKRKGNTDPGRGVLIGKANGSNTLRNSIRVKTATMKKILITSDLKYSAVHNYGLKTGRGKGFTMPKRQFMGKSKKLDGIIVKLIKNKVNEIMKP